MAQSREPGLWLFGGVFEVVGRRNESHTEAYDVVFHPELLAGCVRRLKIAYVLPGRATRRRMEAAVDDMHVAEILPTPFAGEPFPGHDRIDHSLRELGVVYGQQRPDWRGALEHMKGVYVIHDQTSGKPYVGSACGDTGLWARWGQYVASIHGDNVDLRQLVERRGTEDIRDDLRFALLEFWSMRTPDAHVLEREAHWKRVLLSREYGHNRN